MQQQQPAARCYGSYNLDHTEFMHPDRTQNISPSHQASICATTERHTTQQQPVQPTVKLCTVLKHCALASMGLQVHHTKASPCAGTCTPTTLPIPPFTTPRFHPVAGSDSSNTQHVAVNSARHCAHHGKVLQCPQALVLYRHHATSHRANKHQAHHTKASPC
jgi:hypothetical protein